MSSKVVDNNFDKKSCVKRIFFFSLSLQVVTFNNRANDVSLRVSSIEYLGVVAAHLRKDAVVSQQQDAEIISEILVEVTRSFCINPPNNLLLFNMGKLKILVVCTNTFMSFYFSIKINTY